MRDIIVPKLKVDSLAGQLVSLYESLRGVSPNEVLNFDLNKLAFACPLLILPICAYINTTKSKYTIHDAHKIKSYLNIIDFPDGVTSVSSFRESIQKEKSYIPISILAREKATERERLESLFSEMVYKTLDAPGFEGIKNAIYYPISELITNIFEHSKQDQGFIFGQFYPKKDWLDICIVDRGRGLRAAYEQEKNLKLSDEKSIEEVMRGNSTKSDNERGYGVRTSKQVVCAGLGGEFTLISGSSALLVSKDKERLISLPNFHWQGVIIAYKIPRPKRAVDISPYLE